MSTIDYQQAYDLAIGAGATPEEARILAAIAKPESGYNTQAHNGNANTGDNSYGLWQINMLGQMGVNRAKAWGLSSYDELFDPATNAKAALSVLRSQGFKAWTTYTSGAYKSGLSNLAGGSTSGAATTDPNDPAYHALTSQQHGDTLGSRLKSIMDIVNGGVPGG